MSKPQARTRKSKSSKLDIEVLDIGDLVPQKRNARERTDRNLQLINDSLEEVGPWRSIAIDEADEILGGNGVTKVAAAKGIKEVWIVDNPGDVLIAVRRKGLTEKQKERFALYDNKSSDHSEWDPDVLGALPLEITEGIFLPDELEVFTVPGEIKTGSDGAYSDALHDRSKPSLRLVVDVGDIATVERALKATGEANRAAALLRLCESFLSGTGVVQVGE